MPMSATYQVFNKYLLDTSLNSTNLYEKVQKEKVVENLLS